MTAKRFDGHGRHKRRPHTYKSGITRNETYLADTNADTKRVAFDVF